MARRSCSCASTAIGGRETHVIPTIPRGPDMIAGFEEGPRRHSNGLVGALLMVLTGSGLEFVPNLEQLAIAWP